MIEDIRSTDTPPAAADAAPRRDAYDAPTMTTLGDAVALTAGPVTTTDESPSGMHS